jgi:hypothetical protein
MAIVLVLETHTKASGLRRFNRTCPRIQIPEQIGEPETAYSAYGGLRPQLKRNEYWNSKLLGEKQRSHGERAYRPSTAGLRG